MEWGITHIVPFDMGKSFVNVEGSYDTDKDGITQHVQDAGYRVLECSIPQCFRCFGLEGGITCHLLNYGVGVFVIEDDRKIDLTEITKTFGSEIPCGLYHAKQQGQGAILNVNNERFAVLRDFMHTVWDSVGAEERPCTSRANYKNGGLSYVLSIYHIVGKPEEKDISMLMNPHILNDINDPKKWASIRDKIAGFEQIPYENVVMTSVSRIASSWSAVAVVEEEVTKTSLSKVRDYEVQLQASWFLLDCLIYNITNSKMSSVQLQKARSLATNISLDMDVALGANMSQIDIKAYESIMRTSGFELLEKKLFLLLDNRLSIAEAKIAERQSKYGIITEILLVLFTVISIYDPLRNIINGDMTAKDIVLGVVMAAVFAICSFLIIRREK